MSGLAARLRSLFGSAEAAADAVDHDEADKRFAAAALLVETAVMDGSFDDDERTTVAAVLRQRFQLDEADTEALIADAEARTAEAQGVFRFTSAAKTHFSHEERVELIEMLWEVAYADGVLHDYEDNLLRRVAGLIYVTDRERGEARKRVLDRLGLS
ncbi:MAG: TerB family tellurite resistance protein [Alphaproteobacteria bacterium]|nr:TerB family tellurite resistance protein [Alphaproteobacteria bacterium]